MTNHSQMVHEGSIALVSYVPGPLGPVLDQLRQGSCPSGSTRAHVTLLPPRPLIVSLEHASEQMALVLQNYSPFQIELTGICIFPETNVVYLDIGAGSHLLRDIHRDLNAGVLHHAEFFPYHPHLTLSSPLTQREAQAAEVNIRQAWNLLAVPLHFQLAEVVLLWRAYHQEEWQRLWTRRLGSVGAAAAAHSWSYL